MQSKKPSIRRQAPKPRRALPLKGPPRRPVGVQTLGPLHYEQLRQALLELATSQPLQTA